MDMRWRVRMRNYGKNHLPLVGTLARHNSVLPAIQLARVHELAVLTSRQNLALPRRGGAIRQGYLSSWPLASRQAQRRREAGQAEAASRSASLRTGVWAEPERRQSKPLRRGAIRQGYFFPSVAGQAEAASRSASP